MSVICQNFVQNAWKKDLCSNCFKSVGDHDSEDSFTRNLPPANSEPPNGTTQPEPFSKRYVAQSATVYSARAFSGHTTWKSLLVERKETGSEPFKLENGFHGKLLTINTGGSPTVTNGTEDIISSCPSSVNGIQPDVQGDADSSAPLPQAVQGILKTEKKPLQRKSSVGFKEEEPMVIGYGGDDYDGDDHSWEASSDEGGDSLDETEEDKAMSKITLENTEFNSNNVNLLQTAAKDSKKRDDADNQLVNGTSSQPAQNGVGSCSNGRETSFVGARDKNTPPSELGTSQCGGAEDENNSCGKPAVISGDPPSISAAADTPPTSGETEKEATCLEDSDAESNVSSLTSLGSGSLSPVEDAPSNTDGSRTPPSEKQPDRDVAENSEQCDAGKEDVAPAMPLGVLHHVTARDSFLHGPSSEKKDDVITPNATYSPAADFFISRTSSSSSSSSDDVSLSPDSISNPAVTPDTPAEETSARGNPPKDGETRQQDNPPIFRGKPELPTTKPKVPAKPAKPGAQKQKGSEESPVATVTEKTEDDKSVHYATAHAVVPEVPSSATVNHYAESNIYHEVSRTPSPPDHVQKTAVRESKLAALAMELEQARCYKRQAPTPPKIPEPPSEEPPSNAASAAQPTSCPPARSQTMPIVQVPQPLASSSLPGSSSSSSKSYVFHPVAKSKSSFLLSQYSKCKMFAMGNPEDGSATSKSKKKFSLKKLWKFGKEPEEQPDPNVPNPKAWKMNDFDRTKMKLKIIHPMDLINREEEDSTDGLDDEQYQDTGRNSPIDENGDSPTYRKVSLRGGEDRDSSVNDDLPEGSYEVVSVSSYGGSDCELYRYNPRGSQVISALNTPVASYLEAGKSQKSPTPSRASQSSVSGSTTSSGSRNVLLPARPPKPPPPPRSYSVLPPSKSGSSVSCFQKLPEDADGCADDPGPLPPKPQVPKRQFRPSSRGEYANLGDVRYPVAPKKPERVVMTSGIQNKNESCHSVSQEHSYDVLDSCATYDDVQCSQDSSLSEGRMYYEPPHENTTSEENKHMNSNCKSTTESKPDASKLYASHVKKENNSLQVTVPKSKNYSSQSVQQKKEETGYSSTHVSQGPVVKGSGPNRPPHPFTKSPGCTGNPVEKPWTTLEASYSALSATNHEILAKLIEKGYHEDLPPSMQSKRECLQWIDFELISDQPIATLDNKLVFDAVYRHSQIPVTLIVVPQNQSSLGSTNSFNRPILTHFTDNIHSYVAPHDHKIPSEFVASVYVLSRTVITGLECFLQETNSGECSQEQFIKEISFIMLQAIHILKNLQAQGIETIDANFQNLLLAKNEKDKLHSLIFLTDDIHFEQSTSVFSESTNGTCKKSLCEYALNLLLHLLKVKTRDEGEILNCQRLKGCNSTKAFINIVNILAQEKAFSLSQAKTLLEYVLWGANDIIMSPEANNHDKETLLQRWLDVERSFLLKNLMQQYLQSYCASVFDEFHLHYLVRTTARSLKELSALV